MFSWKNEKVLDTKEKNNFWVQLLLSYNFAFIAAAESRPLDALAASRHPIHDDCSQLLQLLAGHFALLVKWFWSTFCLFFFCFLFFCFQSTDWNCFMPPLPKKKQKKNNKTFNGLLQHPWGHVVGGCEVMPLYTQSPSLASWWTHKWHFQVELTDREKLKVRSLGSWMKL